MVLIKKVLKITSNEKVKTWINENFEEILYSARYWSIVHYVKKTKKLKSEIKELQNTIRFREIWTSVLSVEAVEGGGQALAHGWTHGGLRGMPLPPAGAVFVQ